MKIPYFCCIGAELKRYAKDFDFMNQVYLYKVPTDDTMEEVLAQDYFQAVADTVLQDDIVYIYEPTTEILYTCHFNKQNGHITAEQMVNNIPSLTPDKILISDATGHITAGDVSLDYIKNQLLAKVNTDGSSIMTGPLKFRAGSFSGAIAGSLGDGIAIYKLKADGSIDSEVASLTKTNGFTPGTTNAQNIGSPTLKWKDAHVARIITAVLNNGYDIAVPVTNGPDTLALKSEVDNAANSGRMITDTGVWYAKMYSASTVPTGAEYDGTNYADFSQTDGDGNPVIKIYTGASGAWTLTDTITPPANYDGYVPVTKKMWDIIEQTGQQGGRVLWNHQSKQFTPYPNIVDLSDVATTDLDNLTPTGEAKFTAKANTDMDNLTDTGANIGNWSSNVTNCITHIPQDIKLELNAGTLTLKAGSKVYYPDGTYAIVASDSSTTATNADAVAYYNENGGLGWAKKSECYAQPTAPTATQYMLWWDTTNNVMKHTHDNGSTWQVVGLPVCSFIANATQITELSRTFNGFGFMGPLVFMLPGVKMLIPNGRNADGSLKNIEWEADTVYRTNYRNWVATEDQSVQMGPSVNNIWNRYVQTEYMPATNAYTLWYKPSENVLRINNTANNYTSEDQWTITTGGIYITNIGPGFNVDAIYYKQPNVFHTLDYRNTEYMCNQAMPSGVAINLTPANNTSYKAPADGWFVAIGSGTATNMWLELKSDIAQGVYGTVGWQYKVSLAVKKGASCELNFNNINITTFKFVYANGAIGWK